MMNDKIRYNELKKKLETAGCKVNIDNCCTKGFDFPEKYDYIIHEYMGTFESAHLNSFIVHCLIKPKRYSIIPILLDQFYKTSQSRYRWTLGDGLYIIGYNDQYFNEYMSIASDKQYGEARQMIVWLLGKSKRYDVLDFLFELMKSLDYDVLLHTMAALYCFKKDPQKDLVYEEVKKFIDFLTTNCGKEKYKNGMKIKLSSDFFYRDTEFLDKDIQEAYKSLIKEAEKILKWNGYEIKKENLKLY